MNNGFKPFSAESVDNRTPLGYSNGGETRPITILQNLQRIRGSTQANTESRIRPSTNQPELLKLNNYPPRQPAAIFNQQNFSTRPTYAEMTTNQMQAYSVYQNGSHGVSVNAESFVTLSGSIETLANPIQSYPVYHSDSRGISVNSDGVSAYSNKVKTTENQMSSYHAFFGRLRQPAFVAKRDPTFPTYLQLPMQLPPHPAHVNEPEEIIVDEEGFETHSGCTEIPNIQMPLYSTDQNSSQEANFSQQTSTTRSDYFETPADEMTSYSSCDMHINRNIREIPTPVEGRDQNSLNSFGTHSSCLETPDIQMSSYSTDQNPPQEANFSQETYAEHSDYSEIPTEQIPSCDIHSKGNTRTQEKVPKIPTKRTGRYRNPLTAVPDLLKDFRDQMPKSVA